MIREYAIIRMSKNTIVNNISLSRLVIQTNRC